MEQLQWATWPREVHEKDGYVYIGRADDGQVHMATTTSPGVMGWLGNPYKLKDYSREESIEKFRRDFYHRLRQSAWFRRSVLQCVGKKLVCWCKPEACHGDVIAEYLNDSLNDIPEFAGNPGDDCE